MPTQLFSDSTYTVRGLVEAIDKGEIALPEIQRPFVWTPTKARNLFDSMYRGFPVGYLLFWVTGVEAGAKRIGVKDKEAAPHLLIVDGQQRLTCLYAVLTDKPVLRDDYVESKIRIAFRPATREFAVTDAAIERSADWLADISALWKPNTRLATIRTFLDHLSAQDPQPLGTEERDHLWEAIEAVYNLQDYPFRGVQLNAEVDEEQVADIFVRINSEGVPLKTADFILTLMSVWWDKGRTDLELFARQAKTPHPSGGASPHNHLIRPDPDQLVRVEVALAFRRAVLKYVYSLLRGKDLDTGEVSAEQRESQFAKLQVAHAATLHLDSWHEYLRCVTTAGFTSSRMISSSAAVMYGYALWLIGRHDFKMSVAALRGVLARWFFASHTSGRYSGSPESRFESDLNLLQGSTDASGFTVLLDRICADIFTSDYWATTYPNEISTSASKSPALSAYYAALNILGAEVLFSHQKVSAMLDPATVSTKGVDRHHLFPKAFLKRSGETNIRQVNQIANMAFVEWFTNIAISDEDPAAYWPAQREVMLKSGEGTPEAQALRAERLARQMHWHGLPEAWHLMEYEDFLDARRHRIADVVKEAWEVLQGY